MAICILCIKIIVVAAIVVDLSMMMMMMMFLLLLLPLVLWSILNRIFTKLLTICSARAALYLYPLLVPYAHCTRIVKFATALQEPRSATKDG